MVIVVFRSRLRPDADLAALEVVGARMYELGSAMPGFVSYKDFAAEDGETLTLVEFETRPALVLSSSANTPSPLATRAGPTTSIRKTAAWTPWVGSPSADPGGTRPTFSWATMRRRHPAMPMTDAAPMCPLWACP
jgi:hypothetical protein